MKRILIPALIIFACMLALYSVNSYGAGHITHCDDEAVATASTISDSLQAHDPASTFTVATSGGDYTTIQAALDASGANSTIHVYPGTYTDDTIRFTANNQTVHGMGVKAGMVHVTTANDTICDFGAYTTCAVEAVKMSVTAATSDIPVVAGSGSCNFRRCEVEMTNYSDNTGSQPSCYELTGTARIRFGKITYNNGVDDEGNNVLKAAIIAGTGASIRADDVTIDVNGGIAADSTALGTTVGMSAGTGEIDLFRCDITVDDHGATYTVGMAYISGGTGTHETEQNVLHVNNNTTGKYAVGIYIAAGAGAATFRSMYNHIHTASVSGTAYSFMNVGTSAIVRSQLDDIVAADGYNNVGTLTIVSSETDGKFTISDTSYPLPLWAVPDTVNSGDDAITVKALSDSALSSGQNNYIFCYGDGDGTDDYAQFVQNVSFTIDTPDTLVAWIKISETDSCGVDFMLRQRTAAGTTVYMDTTLANPTGFTDNTWTRIALLFGEHGYATVPRNTVLDLILKVQTETDETVSVTNVVVK